MNITSQVFFKHKYKYILYKYKPIKLLSKLYINMRDVIEQINLYINLINLCKIDSNGR